MKQILYFIMLSVMHSIIGIVIKIIFGKTEGHMVLKPLYPFPCIAIVDEQEFNDVGWRLNQKIPFKMCELLWKISVHIVISTKYF